MASYIVEPAGPLSEPLTILHDMLAESTTFQTCVGAGNASEAVEHIYFDESLNWDEQIDLMPYAIVTDGDDLNWTLQSGGARNYLRASGSLLIILTDYDRYTESLNDGYLDFRNFAVNTIQDVADLAGADRPGNEQSWLAITEINTVEGPYRNRQDRTGGQDSHFKAAYQIVWE